MRLEKCYFCSSTCYPGHGITFVRNDCRVFKFCRPKCHRAFKKRKNPRRVRWTKAYRKATGKDLALDPVLEFERKRNIPIKYDRELWDGTVEAMRQIAEIRQKRQGIHLKNRLKVGKTIRKMEDMKRLDKNISLIKSPAAALQKEKLAEEQPQTSMETLMEEN